MPFRLKNLGEEDRSCFIYNRQLHKLDGIFKKCSFVRLHFVNWSEVSQAILIDQDEIMIISYTC
ncbi:MAG: hypothetical protein A2W90_03950 [Bacteroidetes bacterium GWF2_42_66]|nr:MAG: hypothetical protein A2W92_06535 [Bacteroidetes bacterium GWA2_42_15]OFY02522.1 MAG: hypothetical protein A2W89_21905 [Bacteroidetes bacterium GWE2_42_39]OFY41380.1 MAG: hypothetical protein A2W90_03950 [Bacteroidetes bacterium GWF2_42_66]HBL75419.1 hypothetical protein [Prolixibacteraceae bacterium]HCU60672.1 hypothetical protein [Prolixibacteraceae bacterium]